MNEQGWGRERFFTETVAECFPLLTLLKALGVDVVNYFSLDIEGHELPVLKAVPFHDIHIDVSQQN